MPMRLGVTPVPIPNTMVKTQAADDTALETMWESRWVPGYKKEIRKMQISFLMDLGSGRFAAQKIIYIDTGKDEQQLIAANPISRAVLL